MDTAYAESLIGRSDATSGLPSTSVFDYRRGFMQKLADVVHLVAVFAAVTLSIAFVRPAFAADPYAANLGAGALLGIAAVVYVLHGSGSEPTDPILRILRKLGLWAIGGWLKRVLALLILGLFVVVTWLLGDGQVETLQLDCDDASSIAVNGGESRTCKSEPLTVWRLHHDPYQGVTCAWTGTETQPATVTKGRITCTRCRVRNASACSPRPKMKEQLQRVADAAIRRARQDAVEARAGSIREGASVLAAGPDGKPKALGQLLVELNPGVASLDMLLRSSAPTEKVVFLTGAGGQGKGPTTRYLARRSLPSKKQSGSATKEQFVLRIDLADIPNKKTADPYFKFGEDEARLPFITLPSLDTIPVSQSQRSEAFEKFLNDAAEPLGIKEPRTAAGVVVDSLDEFDSVTRGGLLHLAEAWATEHRKLVVFAGRPEGFRDFVRDDGGKYRIVNVTPLFFGRDRDTFAWFLADYACHNPNGAPSQPTNCGKQDVRNTWARAELLRARDDFWGVARFFAYSSAQANKLAEFLLARPIDKLDTDEALGLLCQEFLSFAFNRGKKRHGRADSPDYREAMSILAAYLTPSSSGQLSGDLRGMVVTAGKGSASAYDLLAFSSFAEFYPMDLDEISAAYYPPVLQVALLCATAEPKAVGKCVREAMAGDAHTNQ